MSEYAFKNNIKKYKFKNQELECIMAYFNMFLSLEDISRLFGVHKEDLKTEIQSFYNNKIYEKEVHYTFIDWEKNKTEYYNLDVIFLLNEENQREDVIKFLLWANRKLKSYLIKHEFKQDRIAFRNVSDEIDFTLPEHKIEVKNVIAPNQVFIKQNYKKLN